MYGQQRQLKSFNKFEPQKPEPRIMHQTFKPYQDTDVCTKFDVRSSGMNAHMASTMFLERKYKVQIQQVSPVEEQYALREDADHTRQYRPINLHHNGNGTCFIRKPGFLLQNNTKAISFDCNAGSVECDTRFLNAYSKLYQNNLKQYIRASGKSFSNHKDNTERGYALNTINGIQWSSNNSYVYVNPERNERRIPKNAFTDIAQIDNEGYAYWYEQPWDVQYHDNYMDHDLADTFVDSVLFPDGPFNSGEQKVDENGHPVWHYEDDVQVPTVDILPGTSSIVSADFQAFYDKYWKAADDAAEKAFMKAVDKVYSNGVISRELWADDEKWDDIRYHYEIIFQSLDQAIQEAIQEGDIEADAGYAAQLAFVVAQGYEDHLGWGFDLTRPFAENKLYIKTATRMLQFADELIRYHRAEASIFSHDLAEIRNLQERINLMIAAKTDAETSIQAKHDAIQLILNDPDATEEELEEADYLLQDMEFTVALYAKNYGFPGLVFTDAEGNNYIAQVQAIIVDQQQDLADLINAFDTESEALTHAVAHSDVSSWKKALQVFSRVLGYMEYGFAKDKYQYQLKDANEADIVVFEPVVVGPCKPSEYCEVGCWKENSNIIPYIERFQLSIQWASKSDLFELDQYFSSMVVTDVFTGKKHFPKLAVIEQETKLHVNFVEHPVSIPAAIPLIDTNTIQIAQVSTAQYETQTISFRDIDLRRNPKHIMIHCVPLPQQRYEDTIASDKSASIVGLKLRTDIQYKSLEAHSVEYVNALTCRNFPEYIPPSDLTGNVFCISMNELPQAKTPAEYIHLMGEIKVCQNWAISLDYYVYITLFYGDKYWQIQETYQRGVLDLE